MKFKMLVGALLSTAAILILNGSTPTPGQGAGGGDREKPDEAVSSESGGQPGAGTKARNLDESVSSGVENAGGALVSEGFAGEGGGGGAVELVPGFDAGRALGEAYRPSQEELASYKELQDIPPIELVLFKDRPETVCGPDDRVQITNTTAIPWRWNCQLILNLKGGGQARGTGWFIGPCTVLTAGHCVHTGRGGDWMQSIEVIPGMNGASRPYGSQTSSNFRSVTGWTQDGNPEYDYGAIILPNSNLGNQVGWFGLTAPSDSGLNNLTINTAGYPGDKPLGTQWFTSGPLSSVQARRLGYMLDTYPGQSGSSVWRFQNNQRHGVGIHNYGGCPNHASRITSSVFNTVQNWKDLCQ